ncbi:MAG: CdaR family protein [Myxococcota bacterium]|nr:CdaR family protein [Myxococcota bacterium]
MTPAERMRNTLRGGLTREMPFKVLSLAFAIMIWAWVQTQQIVSQRTRAQVLWSFPDDLTWIDPVPKTLVVTIRGPQGLVRNVKKRTLRYDVDLSESEQGLTSVDFAGRSIRGIPEGVSVVQISPPGVDVQLDRRMERVVKVVPAVVGEVESGYRVASITVDPKTTNITGPRSVLRTIADIGTDVLDVNGLTEDKTYTLALAPKDRSVVSTLREPVKVTVDVEPIIAEKTFTDVPIMARADGWKTTPTTAVVTLSGPAAAMRELTADRISVQAHLPNPTPVGEPLVVRFNPSEPGTGLDVVHQGAKDIAIVKVVPDSVVLQQTP